MNSSEYINESLIEPTFKLFEVLKDATVDRANGAGVVVGNVKLSLDSVRGATVGWTVLRL